jgi:hypothetical protein
MPAIAGALGILVCLAAEQVGFNIDERYSILIEKLLKSKKEIKVALKKIDQKLDAIILGDLDSAEISIGKIRSSDLSQEQKQDELTYAIRKLEEGYSRLGYLPESVGLCAQIASFIASCYFINNQKKLAKEWLVRAKNDCNSIIQSPQKPISIFEEKAKEVNDKIYDMMYEHQSSEIGWKGKLEEQVVQWAGLALAFPTLPAVILSISTENKEAFNKQLDENKKEANQLLIEVENTIRILD